MRCIIIVMIATEDGQIECLDFMPEKMGLLAPLSPQS